MGEPDRTFLTRPTSGQDLDCDAAFAASVAAPGKPDAAHAPFAEGALEGVPADPASVLIHGLAECDRPVKAAAPSP